MKTDLVYARLGSILNTKINKQELRRWLSWYSYCTSVSVRVETPHVPVKSQPVAHSCNPSAGDWMWEEAGRAWNPLTSQPNGQCICPRSQKLQQRAVKEKTQHQHLASTTSACTATNVHYTHTYTTNKILKITWIRTAYNFNVSVVHWANLKKGKQKGKEILHRNKAYLFFLEQC